MASTTHSVTTLASSNDLDALLLSHPHVVLNFWASWCEPAKQMNNVVQELSKAYSNVTFVQIEAEQFPDVSEKYEVKAVPFYVFIQDKNVVDSVEGANPPEITRKSKALSEGKLAPAQPKPAATPVVSATPTATPSSTTDITARLVQLINQAPVVLFMKGEPNAPRCGFSSKIVNLLNESHIKFATFDILSDMPVREALKKYSNWPTYPQLYISGKLVGGLDIVKELNEEGELLELVPPEAIIPN
eukprot:TRINITY_DN6401_c0_g1_i3.p1 TRINITY_DN6401_c0_g1~~TRINITY_DN6401_c0_g1_i3.p1  ORF type:complete len:267 (+),score=56.55 TRINITY_DN6401_c0_g1_i3:68-802(+)